MADGIVTNCWSSNGFAYLAVRVNEADIGWTEYVGAVALDVLDPEDDATRLDLLTAAVESERDHAIAQVAGPDTVFTDPASAPVVTVLAGTDPIAL